MQRHKRVWPCCSYAHIFKDATAIRKISIITKKCKLHHCKLHHCKTIRNSLSDKKAEQNLSISLSKNYVNITFEKQDQCKISWVAAPP